MKKLAISLIVAGIALIGMTPTVAGAKNDKPEVDLTYPPTSESVHLKATICHWANGNLSEPSVSLSAVTTPQDVKHGSLTLTVLGSLNTFVPHDSNGHEQDAIIDIYLKHGNDVVYLYQANTLCNPAPTTTTTQPPTTTTTEPPVVTTTTQPPVTTTTEPPVVTTTTEPPVTVTGNNCVTPDGFPYVTNEPCPAPAGPAPAGPAPAGPSAPAAPTQLPHTGAATNLLVMLGAGLAMFGSGLKLLSRKVMA